MVFDRVVIVGVGLIGGSVALAVRHRHSGCEVTGIGRNDADVAAINSANIVHRATTDLSPAADADLVVIATPVGAAVSVLDRLPNLRGIVTDVLSTKRSIVQAAADRRIRFVGSHPMAGSERPGVANARADLLTDATCLITPTDRTAAADVEFVEAFWTSIGMKTTRLTPDLHDRLVATASHVPHVVAAALVSIQSAETFATAAGGLRDTTRIASGDADSWRDILLDNRDRVSGELKRLRAELDRVIARLDGNDAGAVRNWLAAAAELRGSVYNDPDRK